MAQYWSVIAQAVFETPVSQGLVTSTLVVNGYPSSTIAGDAHDVTITAKDAYGNTTPAYTGTVHLTSSDVVRHRIVQDIVDAYERAQPPAPER